MKLLQDRVWCGYNALQYKALRNVHKLLRLEQRETRHPGTAGTPRGSMINPHKSGGKTSCREEVQLPAPQPKWLPVVYDVWDFHRNYNIYVDCYITRDCTAYFRMPQIPIHFHSLWLYILEFGRTGSSLLWNQHLWLVSDRDSLCYEWSHTVGTRLLLSHSSGRGKAYLIIIPVPQWPIHGGRSFFLFFHYCSVCSLHCPISSHTQPKSTKRITKCQRLAR